MKKILSLLIAMLLFATVLVGCSPENDSKEQSSTEETIAQTEETIAQTEETKPDYESEVIDILNSTSYMDSIDPSYVQYGLCSDISFGQLIASMFEDPVLDITPTTTTDGEIIGYQVTVSGCYRDTPSGYYINEGEAYITINLSSGRCSLNGDHYFKSAASNYAFTATGFYN